MKLLKNLFIFIFLFNSLCAQLVEVIKEIPDIVLDIKYSTTDNFTKQIVYPSAKCFLQKDCVGALKLVQEELKTLGLGLKIWDGYRPFSVQEIFWQFVPDEHFVMHPVRDEKGLPVKGSKHNRGAAVDLTIINLETKQELIMISGFDEFDFAVYKNATQEAKDNSLFLESIMVKYGFTRDKDEWWHFDWHNWKSFPLLDINFDQLS